MIIQKINSRMELQKRFIDYLRTYDGPFTSSKDLRRWMEGHEDLQQATSKGTLKQMMRGSPDFYDSELYKVDHAYTNFLEEVVLGRYQLVSP